MASPTSGCARTSSGSIARMPAPALGAIAAVTRRVTGSRALAIQTLSADVVSARPLTTAEGSNSGSTVVVVEEGGTAGTATRS